MATYELVVAIFFTAYYNCPRPTTIIYIFNNILVLKMCAGISLKFVYFNKWVAITEFFVLSDSEF